MIRGIDKIIGILPTSGVVRQEEGQAHRWIFTYYCCTHHCDFDATVVIGYS